MRRRRTLQNHHGTPGRRRPIQGNGVCSGGVSARSGAWPLVRIVKGGNRERLAQIVVRQHIISRNGDLNGRDFFAPTNDQLKRNQFGGVIGGPIRKDRLFFFVGYQGTITRQTSSSRQWPAVPLAPPKTPQGLA